MCSKTDEEELSAEDLKPIESCIAWAAQQGYCFADNAAKALGRYTGREMYLEQAMYNTHGFRDIK